MANTHGTVDGERADLLAIFADQRRNFLFTVDGIDDAQAAERSTVSELTLGGIVKHLAMLDMWLRVIQGTAPAKIGWEDLDPNAYRLTEGETLAGVVEQFRTTADEVDRVIREDVDLNRRVTLPVYPWSPDGEPQSWTVRYCLLHLFRELAQHSGHADIVREGLDGASTTARMAEPAEG